MDSDSAQTSCTVDYQLMAILQVHCRSQDCYLLPDCLERGIKFPIPLQSGFFMETDNSRDHVCHLLVQCSYGYHTLVCQGSASRTKLFDPLSQLDPMQNLHAPALLSLNPERLSNVNCSRCSCQIGFKNIRAIVVHVIR